LFVYVVPVLALKMSKRPSTSSEGSGNTQRKHLTLSIKQKVYTVRELDGGTLVKRLCDKFGVGISETHDIRKKEEQSLKANVKDA
jgi:hypothetical protein